MSVVTVKLRREDAEALRQYIGETLDGRPVNYIPALAPLLTALEAEGIQAKPTVQCPDVVWDGMVGASPSRQCARMLRSEDDLYFHLRNTHRYPAEDAGSSAARAWRQR